MNQLLIAESFKKNLRSSDQSLEAIDFYVRLMYHMSLLKLSEMIKGRNEILSVPVFNRETKVEARE